MQITTPTDSSHLEDVQFVVREFSKHTRREEIMQALMMRRGYSWTEAGQIVDHIATTRQGSIMRRQLPLLTFLTIIGFVTGCALLSYGGFLLVYRVPVRPFMLRTTITVLGTGITMFGGSLIGVVDMLKALTKD